MSELFFQIVSICSGISVIIALFVTLVKPIREKVTGIKTRKKELQDNFDALKKDIDEVKEDLKEVKDDLIKNEKDTLRTQVLLMLADYREEKSEIMKLCEHYFKDLEGDWYATSIFNNWLISTGTAKPEWFKDND